MAFSCFGCNFDSLSTSISNRENTYLKFEVIDSIVISDNNLSKNHNKIQSKRIQNFDYLAALNNLHQKFDLVNLTTARTESIIYLSTIADYEIDDFYFHNLDSLFFLSSNTSSIILSDSHGEIKKEWRLDHLFGKNNRYNNIGGLSILCKNNIFYNYKNNSLWLTTYPHYDHNIDFRFYMEPYIIEFDLDQNEIIRQFGYYPKKFHENKKYYFGNDQNVSILPLFDQDTYYLSFYRSSEVYEFRTHGVNLDLYNKHDFKSNYIENFTLISRKGNPKDIRKSLSGYRYDKLLFDQHGGRFFRIVAHEAQSDPFVEPRYNTIFNRSFSVIVSDTAFNVIGECYFDGEVPYNFIENIVSPKGLLFYRNSSDRTIFDIVRIYHDVE